MRTTLTANGYEVSDARSGKEAIEKLDKEKFDLVLLDVNMPSMTGLEACRLIRRGQSMPDLAIIMLTVRNAEKDKVEALDAGADDYVVKPFSTPELLARIRAALRRAPVHPDSAPQQISLKDVEVDFVSRQVTVRGRSVRLTPKEFDLLRYLVTHPNKPVAHRELLQAVWGPDYGDEVEYLRVFVNQLRKKIEPQPAKPRFLLTEPWVGYRFNLPQ
jgi:two-component system KDP operon response regulator KdpE